MTGCAVSRADLVDDVFVVIKVLLEVKHRVSMIHGVVDRRTGVLVVFSLRHYHLHTSASNHHHHHHHHTGIYNAPITIEQEHRRTGAVQYNTNMQ